MSHHLHTAMILAAGRGERLRPLTDKTPKPLIEVAGKKLIEYHIDRLKSAGITRLVINTAWLAEKIHAALGDGANHGVSICYSDEGEALETAGGIIRALPLLDEKFIVVNGDVWCDFDFTEWMHQPMTHEAHVLLVDNPEHNAEGDFALDNGLLTNNGDQRHTYSGIGIYSKAFFAGQAVDKAPLAPLLRAKSEQGKVSAQHYSGKWTDVGAIERLQRLRQQLHG